MITPNNNPNPLKKYVAYYRVSTDRQAQTNLSLEYQANELQQFAAYSNGCIVGEFTDVESGSKDNRKELQKAIELCKANNAVLLVSKVDRLARSLQKAAQIFSVVDVEVVSLGGKASKFNFQFMAMVAEMELDFIKDRAARTYATRRQRNIANGLPENHGFGNSNIGELGKVHYKKGLQAISDAAAKRNKNVVEIIRLLIDAKGYNLTTIHKELIKMNVVNSKGVHYCYNTVQTIIKRYITQKPHKYVQMAKFVPSEYNTKEYGIFHPCEYIDVLFKNGYKYNYIAAYFNEMQIPTPTGKGVFFTETIKRIHAKGYQRHAVTQRQKETKTAHK
jgi:DNA invertase Pin-like site-specific DNA recombinase